MVQLLKPEIWVDEKTATSLTKTADQHRISQLIVGAEHHRRGDIAVVLLSLGCPQQRSTERRQPERVALVLLQPPEPDQVLGVKASGLSIT